VSLAWIFDVNAGHVERTAPTQGMTGTRLGLVLVGIGVIAAAPGTIWYFAVRGIARRPAAVAQGSVQPSIAVLPFADMSPAGDQSYFSDGIAEEILEKLAQVDGVRIIGRTSSFSFKGKADDLRTIGQRLGVTHVLEGSVRRASDQLRITAQLINASDGSHVWSETYDRRLTDVFAVQDEIAKAVVEALKMRLLRKTPNNDPYATVNAEAHNQYLMARQQFNVGMKDGTRYAMQALEKAIALDPNYVPAHALQVT